MLANLLARSGHSVLVLEKNRQRNLPAMAIGITPPSLDLLATLGLAQEAIARGIPIAEAVVHEEGKQAGRLRFHQALDRYPFVLSLPQGETMALLRRPLAAHPRVRIWEGWRLGDLQQDATGVDLQVVDSAYGHIRRVRTCVAVGCDGTHGATASLIARTFTSRPYAPRFVMGDLLDRSALGHEAHLFFGPERPVESFPLPGGRRRWIVRAGWGKREDLREPLTVVVRRLTGHPVDASDQLNESCFRPRRGCARRFFRGRVALCGDAAHVMSPIGGQGMNTGFGDAAHLAAVLDDAMTGRRRLRTGLRTYSRARRRVFRKAANRAALGMRLGVGRGGVVSALRGWLVSRLLARSTSARFLVRWFTMRSLPGHDVPYLSGAGREANIPLFPGVAPGDDRKRTV
jgi:2-polyprenyl-6-methoxyphenol hydroxylase-like FAD-dependent oxidoreductase